MSDYERAAIDNMQNQITARDAALTQARELLAQAAKIEYQRNRSPRGVSPDGSYREVREYADSLCQQLAEDMVSAITDLYMDDRKNGRL